MRGIGPVVAIDLDEAALAPIGAELGVTFAPEPYRVGGAAVHAAWLTPPGQPPTRLVVWPSLGRVDVTHGQARLVVRQIERVEIYPGIEVMFRRRGGGHLFLTRAGQVHLAV